MYIIRVMYITEFADIVMVGIERARGLGRVS